MLMCYFMVRDTEVNEEFEQEMMIPLSNVLSVYEYEKGNYKTIVVSKNHEIISTEFPFIVVLKHNVKYLDKKLLEIPCVHVKYVENYNAIIGQR